MSPKSTLAQESITKSQSTLNHIETDLAASFAALTEYSVLASEHANAAQTELNDDPDSTGYQSLQLLLQFRLNHHDALRALFQCQQSLWQILGVSPAHSAQVNYERLAYALGSDDLHQLLSMLNALAGALLKVIAQIEKKNKAVQRANLGKRQKNQSRAQAAAPSLDWKIKQTVLLQNAIKHQTDMKLQLDELIKYLETIEGAPTLGEELLEIAPLQGPISRVHQALVNGLQLSGSLLQQSELNQALTPELNDFLHQMNHLVAISAPVLENQGFFSHPKHLAGYDLEEHAAKVRLGNFFHK